MNLIHIGTIVNTHGLKGELRILSSISFKEHVFLPSFVFYVEEKPYKVVRYRKHKQYDMVVLEGISSIEDALLLKGRDVFINRADVKDIFIENDYIGMEVYSAKGNRGEVTAIVKGVMYNYLEVHLQEKKYYVPLVPAFIEKVNEQENKVFIQEMEGLIDED